VVPTQPTRRASSQLVEEELAWLQQPVMPLHRSWAVTLLMRRLLRPPLVVEPDLASHPCPLEDLRDPLRLVEVDFGSDREGQRAC
jgi:hypothetical protein